jgi:hypothetical protein
MPLLHMREIFTPLKFFGVKFFRTIEGETYIKFGKKPRKKLF